MPNGKGPSGKGPSGQGPSGKGPLAFLLARADALTRAFGGRRKAAYTLVSLAIIFTLMNIAVAAALPAWSHIIQHDKEEELIFRGLQYAEALRVFQIRFGRLPTNLKEMMETEPRCLRQLWHNPFHEEGRWALIPAGVGAPIPGTPGGPAVPGQGDLPNSNDDDEGGKGGGTGTGTTPQGTPQVIWSEKPDMDEKLDFGTPRNNLPIRGVYTTADVDAIHFFQNKESIGEWQFTVELVASMQQGTPDNPGFVRPFPIENIGKPFPPGVVPPMAQPTSSPAAGGGVPGGQPGAPGQPGKPGGFDGDGHIGRPPQQVQPQQPGGGEQMIDGEVDG